MEDTPRNKNVSTRLQVLIEIADSGPAVSQKSIAQKLGVTPQAVSEYTRQLIEEGLVISAGRSCYQVTSAGVNYILKMLRELSDYVAASEKAITILTTCAAIAEDTIAQGQAVGLKMRDGLLYATPDPGKGAKGNAVIGAAVGDDVAVTDIEGLVELSRGKISVFTIPNIREGGSRLADLKRLKAETERYQHIGALGIEAMVALKKTGIEPRYCYDVPGVAIEASRHGLPFLVVCTDDEVSSLLKRMEEERAAYTLLS